MCFNTLPRIPRIPKKGHGGRVTDIKKIYVYNISNDAQGVFDSTFQALQVKSIFSHSED